MKQKNTVEHALSPAVPKYPYIGVHVNDKNLSVYFESPKTGACLSCGHSHNTPGRISQTWDEDKFTPLNGSVTLEQEA